MPLEENPYVVPHLKALISGQRFLVRQRCGSTLQFWNVLLKISILLLKIAFEPFWLDASVSDLLSSSIPVTITIPCKVLLFQLDSSALYPITWKSYDWTSALSVMIFTRLLIPWIFGPQGTGFKILKRKKKQACIFYLHPLSVSQKLQTASYQTLQYFANLNDIIRSNL